MNKHRGTTLVEILVVLVIFLIGILAIIQIFPKGFRILAISRANLAASALAHDMIQKLTAQPSLLPFAIAPVKYTWAPGGIVTVSVDETKSHLDMLPPSPAIGTDGIVQDAANHPLGTWALVSGPNVMRRIIDDSYVIPSPRAIGTVDNGSLVVLRYGPLLTDQDQYASGLTYNPAFEVYGSAMEQVSGAPPASGALSFQYYAEGLDTATSKLDLPRTVAAVGARPRTYRVKFTYWISDFASVKTKHSFEGFLVVDSDPAGGFVSFDIAGPQVLNLAPGNTLVTVETQSLVVQRKFEKVAVFTADEPYEYKLLNWNLGELLFNPAGFNYFEYRNTGRVPLAAQVTYDVYDWRLLHDDFKVPAAAPYELRLSVPSVKRQGILGSDSAPYPGLNVPLPALDSSNAVVTENRDFCLMDLDTGAVILPARIVGNYSAGVFTFQDGLLPTDQVDVIYPGDTAARRVKIAGHNLRAIYRANADWSLQPLKAAANYTPIYDKPTIGQYYVGNSAPLGGSVKRIYFPNADLGQQVAFQELWYKDTSNNIKEIKDATFVIRSQPSDAIGLPYVDLSEYDSNAVQLDDTTMGYAVRGVQGASVQVRVMFNFNVFALGSDASRNYTLFDSYRTGFHTNTTQTFVAGAERP